MARLTKLHRLPTWLLQVVVVAEATLVVVVEPVGYGMPLRLL